MLTQLLDGSFAIWTESVDDILFSPETLVERAIPSSVLSLIYQLFIIEPLKVSLNDFLMLLITGSDKSIIGNIQPIPEVCELWRKAIAMGLRIDAGLRGRLLDFLSVLVQAGQKKYVPAT